MDSVNHELPKDDTDKFIEKLYYIKNEIETIISDNCKNKYQISLCKTIINNISEYLYFDDISKELFILIQNEFIWEYNNRIAETFIPTRMCNYSELLKMPFVHQPLNKLHIEELKITKSFRVTNKTKFKNNNQMWDEVHHIKIINDIDKLLIMQYCPENKKKKKKYYNFIYSNTCSCFINNSDLITWNAKRIHFYSSRFQWIPNQRLQILPYEYYD